MARIVPAKPKLRTQVQKDLLWGLQGEISDDFIIFQNRPMPGGCLVIKPASKPIFLYIIRPTSKFDADLWAITDEDGSLEELDDLGQEAYEYLSEMGLELGAIAVIGGDIEAGQTAIELETVNVPLICLEGATSDNLITVPGKTSEGQISDLLSKILPGSSAYEVGAITEGQANLRKKKPVSKVEHSPVTDVKSKISEHDEEMISFEDDDDEMSYILEDANDEPVITKPVRLPPAAKPFHLNLSSAKRVMHLERMIEGYLEALVRERSMYSFGVPTEADFVASAEGMLPALLIAASEEWTPVVVATNGHAAFDIRMTKDPEALIGFRVIDVLVSTPSVLYMPLAHMLKNCFDGESYILDSVVERFGRWVHKYKFENSEIDDIGMHIALKALELDE